jgi:hypothetical protein
MYQTASTVIDPPASLYQHFVQPDSTCKVASMQDHYTTEQLRDRSWTSLMIKAHLGRNHLPKIINGVKFTDFIS